MFASQDGHTATVQVLVDAGADTEARDKVRKNFARMALWFLSPLNVLF